MLLPLIHLFWMDVTLTSYTNRGTLLHSNRTYLFCSLIETLNMLLAIISSITLNYTGRIQTPMLAQYNFIIKCKYCQNLKFNHEKEKLFTLATIILDIWCEQWASACRHMMVLQLNMKLICSILVDLFCCVCLSPSVSGCNSFSPEISVNFSHRLCVTHRGRCTCAFVKHYWSICWTLSGVSSIKMIFYSFELPNEGIILMDRIRPQLFAFFWMIKRRQFGWKMKTKGTGHRANIFHVKKRPFLWLAKHYIWVFVENSTNV